MYTEQTLRAELALIYGDGSDGFMWEQDKSGKVTLDDIVRYCWTVYDKARTASGPQVIGRVADLHEKLQRKVANILGGQTLLDSGTSGSILRMDKWCLVMNDCWVLGGVHRRAPFALMSGATWQNLWNPDLGSFVVTAREVIGLELFGYVREAATDFGPAFKGQATYQCRQESRALAADLEDYHLAVALRESRGPIGAADLVQ